MEAYKLNLTTATSGNLSFEMISQSDSVEVARTKLTNIYKSALNNDICHIYSTQAYFKILNLIDGIVNQILYERSINRLMKKLHAHNLYTFYHSFKVSVLSMAIGHNLGLSSNEIFSLGLAGLLHDIGKTKVPLSILDKPTKLNDFEWSLMKGHSHSMIHQINPRVIDAQVIHGIRDHHERVDGTGYPNQLRGDEISLFGKIIAISDVYDALTSDRAYKKGLCPLEGIDIIKQSSGKHFDLNITELFVSSMIKTPHGMFLILK